MVNENILKEYSKRNIDVEIHSVISKSLDIIYLKENLGWVDKENNLVNVGSWDAENRIAILDNDAENRIAILDNKVDKRRKLFVIDVNNAIIDGNGSILGEAESAINIIGHHDVGLKNFAIQNTTVALFIESSKNIVIEYNSFIESYISIAIIRSSEIKIKNNNIESSINSSTGIAIQNSGNMTIENNFIKFKMNKNNKDIFIDNYCGINTENVTATSILNNNIEIKNSIVDNNSNSSSTIIASCINLYSTYDTIIKSNNLFINENTIVLNSSNLAEINLALIVLNNNNSSIEIEENNILINANNFNTNCVNGGIKNDVILLSKENSSNKIINNFISINNNSYHINSNSNINHYIYMNAIRMEYYNSYNTIVGNTISLVENEVIFKPEVCKAISFLCGVYLSTENITNNILNNNILVKSNDIPINSEIVRIYALIYLYYNNTCNTIMQNNLNESQGNGIVLVASNDNTEIIENTINKNSIYGILLTSGSDNFKTNISLIINNSIEGNGDYGLYIVKGNYYNIIKNNNFVSYEAKNIYDNNALDQKNYYEGNYYNDWNNIIPYLIEGAKFEDNLAKKFPISFTSN